MICDHGPNGHPCCCEQACRTRWLVGSTTGQPFSPAPLPTLILDILETWQGTWMTDREIIGHTTRIRPGVDVDTVARQIRWLAAAGGGKWEADPPLSSGEWVDRRGRLHSPHGSYMPMPHRWIYVESKPVATSSGEPGLMLRVP